MTRQHPHLGHNRLHALNGRPNVGGVRILLRNMNFLRISRNGPEVLTDTDFVRNIVTEIRLTGGTKMRQSENVGRGWSRSKG